jgi:DNA-binding transcriptional regulator GbsR (MarR family)
MQDPLLDRHEPGPEPIASLGPGLRSVLDGVGDLIAFWGFQRSHGRVWALLYFSERPLHAAEISDILDLSAGQVSTSVRELEHWGVVHAHRPSGARRTSYAAESNLFRMVSRVFQERELDQVKRLLRTLLAAKEELERERNTASAPAISLRLNRLRSLVAAAELGRTLIERLVARKLLPEWVYQALDRPIDS